MWSECLEIFQHLLNEKGERLILDRYIPADGTYLIVDKNGNYETPMEIKLDKKSGEIQKSVRHEDICYFDYYSKLLDMNKPIDKKKVIHSNNYLSFSIKKDNLTNGKLTDEIIDEYYQKLENPYLKYEKGPAKKLYQAVEEKLAPIDIELLHKHQEWIKKNIKNLDIDYNGKSYLKIFFDLPKALYEQEGSRYFIPNIYNNNDFNIEHETKIYGIPNNNLGMNAKKPYLANRTRKISTPYLINEQEAFLQKQFMDYLMNFAVKGENNIFIDYEEKTIKGYRTTMEGKVGNGYFLRIQKGKEVEIHYQNIIVDGKSDLDEDKPLKFRDYLKTSVPSSYTDKVKYKDYVSKRDIQHLLDEVLFYKCLSTCMFTPPELISVNNSVLKTNLVMCREKVFGWVTLGTDAKVELKPVLLKASKNLVKDAIENNYLFKAVAQFNLRWSLINYFEGEQHMEHQPTDYYELLKGKINGEITPAVMESDEEFYYGVGQLIRFFISLNRSTVKTHSLANPFFNASDVAVIKNRLKQMFKKYNYDILANSKRFNKLYHMISVYEPVGVINDDLMIAGYLSDIMIYEKDDNKKAADKEEAK